MTDNNETAETVFTRPGRYLSFDGEATLEGARAEFIRRYGVEPQFTWRHNIVLTGPVPEEE